MQRTILIIMLLLVVFQFVATAAERHIILLTPEEAGMEEASPDRYRGFVLNDGPEIKIVQPEDAKEYKSPLQIFVQFMPRNGKEVDLRTFKVECLKLIDIDLTSRVLPYTNKERLKVDNAELPTGNHKIRITIGDVGGGLTQKIFEVVII